MHDLTSKLISWYRQNKRDLPWRRTKDPYLIWLSEIILQQTRINQGLPYYLKFAKQFPTVHHLAKAEEKEVLKLWQGLGYYSRARNLHSASKYISKDLHGKFPSTYNEIIKLKGVGQYTAGAIASIAFNEPKPVVDGNVFRVLSRYFGISTPIDSGKAKKEFYALAENLIDRKAPAQFNQAMMEFGSLQCTPMNPDCSNCILHMSCSAFAEKKVGSLPVKMKKTRSRNRYFNYLVFRKGKKVLTRERTQNDIWKGLNDFPCIETKVPTKTERLLRSKEFRKLIGKNKFRIDRFSKMKKHVLSHQVIFGNFIEFEIMEFPKIPLCSVVKEKEFVKLALPRLIEKFISASKSE